MSYEEEEDVIPFYDLPESVYPFRIVITDIDTGAVTHEVEVTGPGGVSIPGKPSGCREVAVDVHWGDGTVSRAE